MLQAAFELKTGQFEPSHLGQLSFYLEALDRDRKGELEETSVIRKYRITAGDGKSYDTAHYSLDVIISVG